MTGDENILLGKLVVDPEAWWDNVVALYGETIAQAMLHAKLLRHLPQFWSNGVWVAVVGTSRAQSEAATEAAFLAKMGL